MNITNYSISFLLLFFISLKSFAYDFDELNQRNNFEPSNGWSVITELSQNQKPLWMSQHLNKYTENNSYTFVYGMDSTIRLDGAVLPIQLTDKNKFSFYESHNRILSNSSVYAPPSDPACDALEIVYEINGVSDSGATEITVTEGDNIALSLSDVVVDYAITDPNGDVVAGNAINNISVGQSGLYTVTSILTETPVSTAAPIIHKVSSEETDNEQAPASNVLDGDNTTFWHTTWYTAAQITAGAVEPDYPHFLEFDMGVGAVLDQFTYLPRITGPGNGRVGDYEIYVSNSDSDWGTPVATGVFVDSDDLEIVNFPPTQGRYLRFVALTSVRDQVWASAAEITIRRAGPSIENVISEQTGEEGLNAIDGDPDTFWHTQYNSGSGTNNLPLPHHIDLDLGTDLNYVSGLEYLPRQTGVNGTITQYEIYVSNTTSDWGTVVASGTWANNDTLKTVTFPKTEGRYVRLVSTATIGGNFTSAAEINIIRTALTKCVKTIQINVDTVTAYSFENNTWTPSDPNTDTLANFNDEITVVNGEAVMSQNTTVNTITVNPGAALTVNSGVTLTASTTTLKSTSTLYSSLMADGTIEGTVKYERYVNANSGGNDLVSPPLSGETWADFLASDTNATDLLDNGQDNPKTFAFGPFDKIADWYVNYTDQSPGGLNLESGKGYRASTDIGTTLTFTGSVLNTQVAVDIIDTGVAEPTHVYPDWNLIGNPYPSYLDMNLFLNYVLDAGPDPVITNIDILENASGIYGYDGDASGGWDVITLANASVKLMTPGQGFLVAANAADVAAYDIVFDPSMRAIGSDDDFIVGRNANPLTFLKLNATTVNQNYSTEFYFNTNASLGLDHGYDGKILGNIAPSFALYSNLVQDNTGLPIALQALNPSDLENTIIPLGVNASQGEQITFSIAESTIPNTVEVYLEDTVANTVTLLNTGDYTLTPNLALSGIGRFYLRFSSTVLSVGHNGIDNLQIYTTDKRKVLVVSGQLNAASKVDIHDVQGRLVLEKTINHLETINTIDIEGIGSGVYIVNVVNKDQRKTQKIIIQ